MKANESSQQFIKSVARGVFFYVIACGTIYNDWSIGRVYAGSGTSVPAQTKRGHTPSVDTDREDETVSSTGTVRPAPKLVRYDEAAPAPISAANYRDMSGKDCKALAALVPQRCEKWNNFRKHPFSSCREESLNSLMEARTALQLAELYENRANKTVAEIRKELIDKLQAPTDGRYGRTKGVGVEMSQLDAVKLADKVISEASTSQAAYAKCRDMAMKSAWGHNMVLAGVLSDRELKNGAGNTNRCTRFISDSVSKTPSYEDGVHNHMRNGQGPWRHYFNERRAKSQAQNWDLAVSFDKIPSNLPPGYRENGWDNAGYKLYSLDLHAKCSKGHDRTLAYGEGGTWLKHSAKNNWGKWLAGTVVVAAIACAIWCRKSKNNWWLIKRNNNNNNNNNTETNNVTNTETNNVTNTETNNVTNTETNDVTNTETNNVTNTETNDVTNTETNNVTNTETNNVTNTETNNVTNTETNNVTNTETNNVTSADAGRPDDEWGDNSGSNSGAGRNIAPGKSEAQRTLPSRPDTGRRPGPRPLN